MRLVPKFVAGLFAWIAAFVRRLHREYLAAEVKRQRMKEIVRVMQGRRNCASSTSRSCRSRCRAEAAHRRRRASKPTELLYLSPTKTSGICLYAI
jgi:hypothetical protein